MKLNSKNTCRREYLRGLIDGQRIKLKPNHSISSLFRYYRIYLKLNPEAKKEIKRLPDNHKQSEVLR